MNADVRAVLDGSARWAVVCGDSGEMLPTLPAACAAALVTDPPSGIAFMGAEWDHHKGGRDAWVAWLARILGAARACVVPGGRSLVWSIPRTSHWTGCAIDDAGWTIETETCHLFGQGFPKGKSQLKPAHEGWKLARNGPSTPLNIDDCRVGVGAGGSREGEASGARRYTTDGVDFAATPGPRGGDASGRWPATVELSHTPWCQCVGTRRVASAKWGLGERRNTGIGYGGRAGGAVTASHEEKDGTEVIAAWQCVEGCPVLALDRESGELQSGTKVAAGRMRDDRSHYRVVEGQACYGDTGTASRFFAQHPAVDPDEPDPFVYATKVPAAERWCMAVCGCGERVMLLDAARATSRTVDGAAVEDTDEDAPVRELRCADCGMVRVHHVHPTQKSVALMRRFVRLISKPGDLVLDCFGGSGTTGVAAVLEGRRVILIEKDPHFAAIGRARLDAVRPSRSRLARVAIEPVKVAAPDFGPLFGGAR